MRWGSQIRKLALCGLLGSMPYGVAMATQVAVPPTLPVEVFARSLPFSAPLLSPDGKHLAVGVDLGEGHHALQVFAVATMTRTAVLRLPRFEQIYDMAWVSDQRLVLAKGRRFGSLEAPWPTGEIIATNADGKEQAYIYGYEQPNTAAGLDRGFGELAGVPREHDGRIYLRQRQRNERNSSLYEVQTVGRPRFRLLTQVNVPGLGFVVDNEGVPRFAYGVDDQDNRLLFTSVDGKQWQPVAEPMLRPISVLPDGVQALAWKYDAQGRRSLVRIDLAGNEQALLGRDDAYDLGGLEWRSDRRTPFLARALGGREAVTYLQPEAPEAQFHQALAAQMADKSVQVVSVSRDAATYLLYIDSDRDPGAWYLYHAGDFRRLMLAREGIAELQMAAREVVRIPLAEGWIEAVLTRPVGRSGPLPTVVMAHGGPHGVRDDWRFDSQAQFLANRGYLVIQPNFRGSGGRGLTFEESGYRQWGSGMIDDIHASLQWAVAQGLADADRVCSYGGSYGGYAALMLPIRHPGSYRCAAGLAGVYDLSLMHSQGDIQRRSYGRNYLERAIGSNAAELAANSPVTHAAKIQVPVMLVHGNRDERVPLAHSQALRRGLAAAGNAPQWMEVANEGHGFYNDANNAAFLSALEGFLATHLGQEASAAAP